MVYFKTEKDQLISINLGDRYRVNRLKSKVALAEFNHIDSDKEVLVGPFYARVYVSRNGIVKWDFDYYKNSKIPSVPTWISKYISEITDSEIKNEFEALTKRRKLIEPKKTSKN